MKNWFFSVKVSGEVLFAGMLSLTDEQQIELVNFFANTNAVIICKQQ